MFFQKLILHPLYFTIRACPTFLYFKDFGNESDEDDLVVDQGDGGKIGAKKRKKLEMKAEKKAEREVCRQFIFSIYLKTYYLISQPSLWTKMKEISQKTFQFHKYSTTFARIY